MGVTETILEDLGSLIIMCICFFLYYYTIFLRKGFTFTEKFC